MKLQVKFSNRFKSDLKLAKKQNKNLDKLFLVIEKLANLEKLDDKYRDHSLVGEYKGLRECHIEPDWLLIYYVENNTLTLVLADTYDFNKNEKDDSALLSASVKAMSNGDLVPYYSLITVTINLKDYV